MKLLATFGSTPSDDTLEIEGAVRTIDLSEVAVDDVHVRVGRGSRFQLSAGNYVYIFHVDVGAGKFTVAMQGAVPASVNFDTDVDGDYGLTYAFQVVEPILRVTK